MTWKRAVVLVRVAAVVATGALVGAVTTPALASTTVTIPFDADSGDASAKPCGFAHGSVGFSLPDGTPGSGGWPVSGRWDVAVEGVVVDRPAPGELAPVCGPPATPPPAVTQDTTADDGRITFVTFTATAPKPGVPQTASYAVNNGSARFSFRFAVSQPIEQISVQVCRTPQTDRGVDVYCGRPALITAPPLRN